MWCQSSQTSENREISEDRKEKDNTENAKNSEDYERSPYLEGEWYFLCVRRKLRLLYI